jgi:hypothetical protein
MDLSPDLRSRILASAASAPAPTRAQARRARAIILGSGIAGALGVFFYKGGIRLTERPPLLAAMTSLGTAVFAGLAMYGLFTRRGRTMMRRPAAILALIGVAACVAFVLWRFGVSSLFDRTQPWPTRPGFKCLFLGTITGAIPLFAALVSWRRSEPLTPIATGAAFGAGAGLGSAVLVDLWCPVSYLPHLLLGHVLPVILLALLGGLVGRYVLRLRRL